MTGIPVPTPNAETQPYWDAARAGQLIYQYCPACAKPQFYPRRHCQSCHHPQLEWRTSAGMGRIVSFTEVMRAPTPAFKGLVPYVIALVDLDEGFRMMVNIVDSDPSTIGIGVRTKTVFREIDGVTLPQGTIA